MKIYKKGVEKNTLTQVFVFVVYRIDRANRARNCRNYGRRGEWNGLSIDPTRENTDTV